MWPRLRRADQRRTAHSRAAVACQWVDDLRRWGGFADSGKQVVPAVPGAVQLDLDPAPTQVERVTCEADDVDAVHDRRGLGDFFSRSRLEAGETVHRDDSEPSRQVRDWAGSQVLKTCFKRSSTIASLLRPRALHTFRT